MTGSVSPGARLRLASEEFDAGSHRANEYIRSIGQDLDLAVTHCIEAAGLVADPVHQKELLRAAQFGKSFASASSRHITAKNASAFSDACKILRVLNAMRHYKVGVPLTITQYQHLTPPVVVDRLLARRLYPLAAAVSDWLGLSSKLGRSRVLAHWACYKVTARHSDEDDKSVANAIRQKLGNHPQISYCDIAAKAAECGKKDLAIRLLENETSVGKQVPLLVTLGQESQALTRALGSGDRDLAYSVILHLRKNLPSTDFHMLIRKVSLDNRYFPNMSLLPTRVILYSYVVLSVLSLFFSMPLGEHCMKVIVIPMGIRKHCKTGLSKKMIFPPKLRPRSKKLLPPQGPKQEWPNSSMFKSCLRRQDIKVVPEVQTRIKTKHMLHWPKSIIGC